jgi:ADP-L-glycero-D-manno-heptose 6-epimerase
MIVVTGAGGFIGSRLVKYFNRHGQFNIIVVDDFDQELKRELIDESIVHLKLHRDLFIEWLEHHHNEVDVVYHLGARTDTSEMNSQIFDKLNLRYSKDVWNICSEYDIPLIYASSAATYGDGEHGFSDKNEYISSYKPLNPYGQSKQDFDVWALTNDKEPTYWAGIKFFNVFGYGEYNKGRMASVVYHGMKQIKETGKLKLFKSHRDDYEDGHQSRDFIWVEDVVRVLADFYPNMEYLQPRGLYNLGTGQARTFLDLGNAIFSAMGLEPNIEFIDTPIDIRDKYQYFTEAKMNKLDDLGIDVRFSTLEDAVKEYVKTVM